MGEVTVTDTKGNKKTIDGTIEGFTVKKYSKADSRWNGPRRMYLDRTWEGKDVLCVLLDGQDAGKISYRETITVTDNSGNKIIVEGSINGFVKRRYPLPRGMLNYEPGLRFDSDWNEKKVLCILLEKPDI